MPNKKHLSLILKGREEWNAWRKMSPEITIDLSGANLAEMDLSWMLLDDSDLSGACLSGCRMIGTRLRRSRASQAKLDGATLTWTLFGYADLRGADLRGAKAWQASFNHCNLEGALLRYGRFSQTTFGNANLAEADLRDCELIACDLRNADLYGADLRNTVLTASHLDKTNMESAHLDRGQMGQIREEARTMAIVRRPKKRPEETGGMYTVWYGTNRKRTDSESGGRRFGAERDSVIHYGQCRVHIPRSHRFGRKTSWLKRILPSWGSKLQVATVVEFRERAFWKALRAHFLERRTHDRSALIYVHGFNVTFDEAARRAAQIGFDLKVPGATAFFSWPSQGHPLSYMADEEHIRASERALAVFLKRFAERSGAKSVHILAHSMGNRGVLGAIERLRDGQGDKLHGLWDQVFLAAADVEREVFVEQSIALHGATTRASLYCSSRDLAVEFSSLLHGGPRAGVFPPITITRHVDTIAVVQFDLVSLGHSYYADAESVLHDMFTLMTSNLPPRRRLGLQRRVDSETGRAYWEL